MKITVEMTGEEFAEYLHFRKTKEISENRLAHTLNAMNKLANTILDAVAFEEPQNEYEIDDDDKLNEAVALADKWFQVAAPVEDSGNCPYKGTTNGKSVCILTLQPTNGAVQCDFEFENCPYYQHCEHYKKKNAEELV